MRDAASRCCFPLDGELGREAVYMNEEITFFAYVEDVISKVVLLQLFKFVNSLSFGQYGDQANTLGFQDGFPLIMNGNSKIKTRIPSLIQMAEEYGHYSLAFVDLDKTCCAPTLIREWVGGTPDKSITLPPQFFFRVAVHEVESWIMADTKRFSSFLGIKEVNMPKDTDAEIDPKKFIFDSIHKHNKKKLGRMLPSRGSSIGPDYNGRMCDFVMNRWRPEKAIEKSESLKRTINALILLCATNNDTF